MVSNIGTTDSNTVHTSLTSTHQQRETKWCGVVGVSFNWSFYKQRQSTFMFVLFTILLENWSWHVSSLTRKRKIIHEARWWHVVHVDKLSPAVNSVVFSGDLHQGTIAIFVLDQLHKSVDDIAYPTCFMKKKIPFTKISFFSVIIFSNHFGDQLNWHLTAHSCKHVNLAAGRIKSVTVILCMHTDGNSKEKYDAIMLFIGN